MTDWKYLKNTFVLKIKNFFLALFHKQYIWWIFVVVKTYLIFDWEGWESSFQMLKSSKNVTKYVSVHIHLHVKHVCVCMSIHQFSHTCRFLWHIFLIIMVSNLSRRFYSGSLFQRLQSICQLHCSLQ